MGRTLIAAGIFLLGLSGALHASADLRPAFPGALGYGSGATGWRGGSIIAVTTLADAGPGSLRACASGSERPRICVFRISGTIELDSPILARSNLYIAGQTVPGEGVQLRLRESENTPLIVKNASDVVIRFLKLRPGAPEGIRSANIDALTIESSSRVYLDHLSMQFASDETFNIHVNRRPTTDITLANSILSHSLDRSVHPERRHSKGALICSNEGALDAGVPCGRITLAGNLFAHHRDRNPDLKATDVGPVDVIGNVFYDAISQFGEFYDLLGDLSVHYVGNLALAGRSTRDAPRPRAIEGFDWDAGNTLGIYVADSRNVRRPGCGHLVDLPVVDEAATRFLMAAPVAPLSAPAVTADEALASVPARAGARLDVWNGPDALDRRVIDDLAGCEGRVIDRPAEAGGWPALPVAEGPPDADGDGMPDRWEEEHPGLDPASPDDAWADRDGDGWPNIEEYLSTLAGDPIR